MDEQAKKKQEQVAIFRYALVAPALHMGAGEKSKYFQNLAGKEFNVPHYGVKKYGKGTFENWLLDYRRSGLDGLKPHIRSDKGIARKISEKVIAVTKEIIKDYPLLSVSGIYQKIIHGGYIQPGDFCESTLRDYVRKYDLRQSDETKRARKKFEKEHVNELWIADIMHGPCVKKGLKKQKVFLVAII